MPLALLKYAFSNRYPGQPAFGKPKALKSRYDVIIIGGGGHGAAIAWYLAKHHGIRDVAILEKGYWGGWQYRSKYRGDPLQLPDRGRRQFLS